MNWNAEHTKKRLTALKVTSMLKKCSKRGVLWNYLLWSTGQNNTGTTTSFICLAHLNTMNKIFLSLIALFFHWRIVIQSVSCWRLSRQTIWCRGNTWSLFKPLVTEKSVPKACHVKFICKFQMYVKNLIVWSSPYLDILLNDAIRQGFYNSLVIHLPREQLSLNLVWI